MYPSNQCDIDCVLTNPSCADMPGAMFMCMWSVCSYCGTTYILLITTVGGKCA